MSVFGSYSRYYDLLYKDKDYAAEVAFVARLLKAHAPQAKRILELGCGTGMHATLLAREGYSVHGIDLSESMLDVARARQQELFEDLAARLTFSHGNARDCAVGETFDAVISLFHVVSYQTNNDELLAMFQNAAAHLKPGGVFVFDYWFGPAVLTDRPMVRIKRMESEEIAVTRLAEPVLYAEQSWVDVNYHVFIRDKKTNITEELRETHRMHYLFPTEIDLLARASGLKVTHACEWMTGKAPGFDTWGVCSVLTK